MLKTMTVIAVALSAISLPLWADCSGPAGKAGEMIYNADHQIMQFCDGTDWRAMGGSTTVTSAKQCGFTAATYDGDDMGSVAAADAICAAYFESGWTFGTAAKILKYRPGHGTGLPTVRYWASDATNNCSDWTSTSGSGAVVQSNTNGFSETATTLACSSTARVICCNF